MGAGARPLMRTDSERLLLAGVATGTETVHAFLTDSGWPRQSIGKVFTHQVGVAHRKAMLQAFELDPAIDFSTVEWLGNTGAVALPLTMALGIEAGQLGRPRRAESALLGIGSGINSVMLAVEWQQRTSVAGTDLAAVGTDSAGIDVAGSQVAMIHAHAGGHEPLVSHVRIAGVPKGRAMAAQGAAKRSPGVAGVPCKNTSPEGALKELDVRGSAAGRYG